MKSGMGTYRGPVVRKILNINFFLSDTINFCLGKEIQIFCLTFMQIFLCPIPCKTFVQIICLSPT